MYLGIYTKEEKMCPSGRGFSSVSLESVVSSERLLGKRYFFDSLKKEPHNVRFFLIPLPQVYHC